MKAQKIYENIRFERGIDPLKSVGIGQEAIKRKILEETEWDIPFQPEQVIDVYEYKGFPVAIIEMNFKKHYIGNAPKPTYKAVTHKHATFFNEGKTKWFKTIMGAKRDLHNRLNYLLELRRIGAKVRGVKESQEFTREGDFKEKIDIGLNAKVINFLKIVKSDYQFDPEDPNYYGYINLSLDGIIDRDFKEGYILFLKNWRRYLPIMKEMGLYLLDEPFEEQTIIYDESEISGVEAIRESANFERGLDPYDSLTIGKKALLQKKSMSIQWDWYPDSAELDNEEIIDIQEYNGFNIKIVADLESADPQYYAVSDTGEPYMYGPILFNTPEEAFEHQKKFLDEYLEENQ